MTLVDIEGRLFGRWNFIDALAVVLLLAIGPLGYAAYILFRAPDPKLVAVEPAEVIQGPNLRVKIRGANLRPYLRVSFDNVQGTTFLFKDTTQAEVDLNEMPPGTYDVVLYDFGQERYRLPKAFTVKPNLSRQPTQDVVVVGRFIGLSQEDAGTVKKGMPLPMAGEITEIAAPRISRPKIFFGGVPVPMPSPSKFEVPIVIKMSCVMKLTGGIPECGSSDFTLRPSNVLPVPTTSPTVLSLQIDQVLGIEPVGTVRARVRLFGAAEAVAMAARGDMEIEPRWNPFALGATIESLEPAEPRATDRSGTLAIKAQRLPSGWWNGAAFVRVGTPIGFSNERYTVSAMVLSLDDSK